MASIGITKLLKRWVQGSVSRHCAEVIGLLIVIVIIIFLAAAYSYCHEPQPPSGQLIKKSFWDFILSNPGGIFALIVGIATIAGLWVTIESIYTIRSSIHSFSEFVSKTCDLIDTTDNDKIVKILIRTPTTGCFALPPKIWQKLPNHLRESADDKACIYMAIPCVQDIKLWYEQKFPMIDSRLRKTAIEETVRLVSLLQNSEDLFRERKERGDDNAKHVKRRMKVVDWDAFPGYYIVCNNRQAIFAIPFGMNIDIDRSRKIVGNNAVESIPENRPKEKRDNANGLKLDIEHLDPAKDKRKLPPEVIGFESTQFNVVEAANNIFDQFFGETVED